MPKLAERRTLLLILDGVPFSAIQRVYGEGYFRFLEPPVPVISSFPSLTAPAFAELLGTEDPSSYGSLSVSTKGHFLCLAPGALKKANVDVIDFQTSEYIFGLRALTEAAHTSDCNHIRLAAEIGRQVARILGRTWHQFIEDELDYAKAAIFSSKKNHLRIVLNSLDELVHRRGLESLQSALRRISTWVESVCCKTQRLPILVSDHGNAHTAFRFKNFGRSLRAVGFKVVTQLYRPGAVLIPLYSAVSFFPVYVRGVSVPKVAAALAGFEGVDFVAFTEPSGGSRIRILCRHGESGINVAGKNYSYEQITYDVFDYSKILADNHRITASRHEWLEMTANCQYPAGPERVALAFSRVRRPAQILVSLEQDTVYGLPIVHRLYRACCMHGNLTREASQGFLMSAPEVRTGQNLPVAIRLTDVAKYLIRL